MKKSIPIMALLFCLLYQPFVGSSQTLVNQFDQSYLVSALSPDGTIAAVSRLFDPIAKIINARTNQVLREFDLSSVSPGRYNVKDMEFSPDGKDLAIAVEGGFIKIWNVETGEEKLSLDFDPDDVTGIETNFFKLTFSPSGRLLLYSFANSGGKSKEIKALDSFYQIMDMETKQVVQTFSNIKVGLGGLFFPDEKRVLLRFGSNDGGGVFDIATGDLLLIVGDGAHDNFVALSPDGSFIIVQSNFDNIETYTLFNPESGGEIRKFEFERTENTIYSGGTISPNSKLFVKRFDSNLLFIDLSTGMIVHQFPPEVEGVGISANGRFLMTRTGLWDISNLTTSVQDARLHNN